MRGIYGDFGGEGRSRTADLGVMNPIVSYMFHVEQ